MPTKTAPKTRIQQKNRSRILEAALEVFSSQGFRGATLDEIAKAAGLSKPNLLYYFPSKEAVHIAVLSDLMDTWLDPLRRLDSEGAPIEEIVRYVLHKLEMAREYPQESRLFANEILQGAPRISEMIQGELRELVDEKAAVIQYWIEQGQLSKLDPHHLIFSIWATTQHYADFDVQVRGILKVEGSGHIDDAARYLEEFYRRALSPN